MDAFSTQRKSFHSLACGLCAVYVLVEILVRMMYRKGNDKKFFARVYADAAVTGRGEASMKGNASSAMVSFRSASLFASLVFASGYALAQDATSAKGANLSEITWNKAGTFEWSRPEHVRYILVRACGGGGGGAGGFSIFPRPMPRDDAGTATGGGGGAGAAVSTILLGPLTAASYTVVIGRGGRGAASSSHSSKANDGNPGEAGTPTSFTGPDLSFETPGAAAGRAGAYSSRMSDDATSYRYVVTKASSSAPTFPGGGSAQDGARGLMGVGGQRNVLGDAGGGGGSLGKGGAGGDVNGNGAAGGTCAGGGGAGYLQNDNGSAVGGAGGDGSLTLLSIASAPGAP